MLKKSMSLTNDIIDSLKNSNLGTYVNHKVTELTKYFDPITVDLDYLKYEDIPLDIYLSKDEMYNADYSILSNTNGNVIIKPYTHGNNKGNDIFGNIGTYNVNSLKDISNIFNFPTEIKITHKSISNIPTSMLIYMIPIYPYSGTLEYTISNGEYSEVNTFELDVSKVDSLYDILELSLSSISKIPYMVGETTINNFKFIDSVNGNSLTPIPLYPIIKYYDTPNIDNNVFLDDDYETILNFPFNDVDTFGNTVIGDNIFKNKNIPINGILNTKKISG